MATLERAIALAVIAHDGQQDKAGAPYILHPLRVMMGLQREEERMAAVLHDVVEDSQITLEMLRAEGFSERVLRVVDLLTHRAGDDHESYIQRLQQDPVARRIKRLDMEDNMDIRRLNTQPGERDWQRLAKYRRAWERLKDPPAP